MRLHTILWVGGLAAACGGTQSINPVPDGPAPSAAEAGAPVRCAGWALGTAVTHPTGSYPEGIASGDIDGDGRDDLAVVNAGDDNVGLFLGVGDGTFAAHGTVAVGTEPNAIAIGDLNGAGDRDLVVVNGIVSGMAPTSGPTVGVLLGQGGGSFAAQVEYPVGTDFYAQPQAVALGDLDGDGKQDIAVVNQGESTVSVFLGRGDGTFSEKALCAAGPAPQSIALGDLNGDGHPDLAVTNFTAGSDYGKNTVTLLFGKGDGTFDPPVEYSASSDPMGSPYGVAIADFNDDGRPDLAVSNWIDNSASVLLGQADGSFSAPTESPTGDQPNAIAVADYDGDGHADIAVLNNADKTLGVLLGRGDGTFAAQVAFPTGDNPYGVTTADFNRDGHPDVAITNHGSTTVGVYLSVCGGTP